MKRWSGREIALRGCIAMVGGYFLTALWCAVIARSLPMTALDATITSTILSFALYCAFAIRAFAIRSIGGLCAEAVMAALAGLALLKGVLL